MIRLTSFLMQIITQKFWRSIVSVIKHSPELKTDFDCSCSKVEICHKKKSTEFCISETLTSNFVYFICLSYYDKFP